MISISTLIYILYTLVPDKLIKMVDGDIWIVHMLQAW